MEQEAKRIKNELQAPKSYWLERKREREALEKEKNEQALELLEKACKFYSETYPKSEKGITYEEPKGKLPKTSFKLERKEAILLRKVLNYYKNEVYIPIGDDLKVGHAIWRVNQNIPDISRILQLETMDIEIHDLQRKRHELLTAPIIKPPIPIEQEYKSFTCEWCKKVFTSRSEILDHIYNNCPKMPGKELEEEEKIPEKLFTCQICGIHLNRKDIIIHAERCKRVGEPKKEEPPEAPEEVSKFICKECSKDCKNGAGLASHMKIHNKKE